MRVWVGVGGHACMGRCGGHACMGGCGGMPVWVGVGACLYCYLAVWLVVVYSIEECFGRHVLLTH